MKKLQSKLIANSLRTTSIDICCAFIKLNKVHSMYVMPLKNSLKDLFIPHQSNNILLYVVPMAIHLDI